MDFLQRTEEGAAALWRAVYPAITDPAGHPARLGFLAAGEASAWARIFGFEPRLLDAAVIATLCTQTANPVLRGGLAVGSVGQYCKRGEPNALGIAAIALHHGAYLYLLRAQRNDKLGWGLRIGAWAGGLAVSKGRYRVATAVAGAAVAATSALAGDPALRANATKGASHGANLILFSEALTLARTLPVNPLRDSRLLGAAEAASRVLGHFLLVDALERH